MMVLYHDRLEAGFHNILTAHSLVFSFFDSFRPFFLYVCIFFRWKRSRQIHFIFSRPPADLSCDLCVFGTHLVRLAPFHHSFK